MSTRTTEPPVADRLEPPRIAVIGAGVAGAACAAGLLRIGLDVTAFDKSRGVGGRLATRRAQWIDGDGVARFAAFDHGCAELTANGPRFRAVIDRAVALGGATRWRQQVHARFPAARRRDAVVPTPDMPSFCQNLLNGVPLRLGHAVTGLQRCAGGWMLHLADEQAEGPFEHVVLAIPAGQAATLLRGHRDEWADALATVRMSPCWTLMALTDELDWPWDAAQVERGELAWIARNDRVPGRDSEGVVPWVAHATTAWSLAHLDEDPARVSEILCDALGRLLTGGPPPRWHHAIAHRWRHARCMQPTHGDFDHWWSTATGIGVCGDAFGDGSVEAAWCSGDGLASAVIASLDACRAAGTALEAESDAPRSTDRQRPRASFVPLSNSPTGQTSWVPLDAYS